MPATCKSFKRNRRRVAGLGVELLETRAVPAAPSWTQSFALDNVAAGAVLPSAGQLTLHAVNGPSGPAVWYDLAAGTIAAGSAQVDWYQLNLTAAARVTLATFDAPGSSFAGVISLYNNDPDALVDPALNSGGFIPAPNDPLDPIGHRLVAQAEGTASGGTALTWNLAAGTYFVAVSGVGDQYFHPFIADSGLPGSSGGYRLAIAANALTTNGPVFLESNPADNAVLASSPLVLRVDLNQGIDPATLIANQPTGNTVQLLYSADGTFTGSVSSIYLQFHFSPDPTDPLSPGCDELQITPVAPLKAGAYRLVLTGIGQLGSSATNTTIHFQVAGSGPNDTAATAHQLGDLTGSGLTQVAGAIGNDPYYAFFDPAHNDPLAPDYALPANYAGAQVNLYHFTLSGPGSYILLGEVFAGRIGSPLDSGLSLFKRVGTQLVLVTANDNTLNSTLATGDNGYFGSPLFGDSFINAGLTAGDYYLAVSSGQNTPDPLLGRSVGNGIVFDPAISHSGVSGIANANGFTVGDYVLNVRIAPNPGAPHVVSVSPAGGRQAIATPSQIAVRFDQAMNLQQAGYAAFQFNGGTTLPSVFVHGADGRDYFPRFLSFDPTTFTATFQLLDALPNGVNVLHLSGPNGLTNLAGTPLAGNSPGGDFVESFTVAGSPAGSGGPVTFTDQEPNDSLAQAQNLGILFPTMQAAGITVTRNFSAAPAGTVTDTGDYFSFQVTQARQYTFTLSGLNLPPGLSPELFTSTGSPLSLVPAFFSGGAAVSAFLSSGSYFLHLGGWTPAQAQSVVYRLLISIGQVADNPTPLTVGAAPALSIRLVNGFPATPPAVVLPSGTSSGVPNGLSSASGLPALVNLLPNSLLANGPVGGLGGVGNALASAHTAGPQANPSALLNDVLEMIVLTQIGGEEDDADIGPPAPWVESSNDAMRQSWGRMLDMFFRAVNWLELSTLPSFGAPSDPAAGEDGEIDDDTEASAVGDDNPFILSGGYEDSTWAGAVTALAVMHGVSRSPERKRRVVNSRR